MDKIGELADAFSSTLENLEEQYFTLHASVGLPARVQIAGKSFWRHPKHGTALVSYLKGVKLLSTLNAAVTLYRAGHAQEIGALMRIADECCSAMFFMSTADESNLSKEQQQYLRDFFQEEFADPLDPFNTRQKRETVRQKKIHAAFGDAGKDTISSEDSQKLQYVVHGALSGYIHGAYPHIMEMYGGEPPTFLLNGMLGTPRQADGYEHLKVYIHRLAMASEMLALKLENQSSAGAIRKVRIAFEAFIEFPDVDVKEVMSTLAKRDPC